MFDTALYCVAWNGLRLFFVIIVYCAVSHRNNHTITTLSAPQACASRVIGGANKGQLEARQLEDQLDSVLTRIFISRACVILLLECAP
jgi:hypothetical protein